MGNLGIILSLKLVGIEYILYGKVPSGRVKCMNVSINFIIMERWKWNIGIWDIINMGAGEWNRVTNSI